MALPVANLQQAKVKSVLSGDSLLLVGMNNPRAEKTISLAYVSAPRLKREGDEPFAIESREYLRKLLTGRVIQFNIVYSIPQPSGAKREFCIVHMYDGHKLPELQLAEGMIKMRDDAGRREESEEAASTVEKFRMLEARARADGKGIWNPDTPKIHTSYELSNPQQFVSKHKGKPFDAVIEKVLTGDRLVARLFESPTQHVQTMLLLAGIRAPNTKRVNVSDGKEVPAEPFGDDARDFVETRLLQRRVQVHILGVSPQNQLIGSALHPNGDIAVFELKAGLARCVDHHSTLLGQGMMVLRQAEREARNAGLGLFVGAAAPKASASQGEAVVSRVQTADTLYIRLPNGSEKRINLSSVRQPKPSDPKQAPFGAEAKEFMRKRLIGKHVKVAIDGKRPASDGYDEREVATVVQNNVNVGLALVQAGFASVLRHRMDDPDRSPVYDDLLAAEAEAQKDGKGMWSPKPPEAKQYVDYSESLEKAKRLLSLLSRQKRVPAIVDFVKGGSRFTLLIPRENAKITFVLSGINAPKSARNPTEASEPFGKEAHDLANKRCQQRDVEIDVEDNDKVGGFIGKLFVNRENFAKTLLEEGFASVRVFSAEKSGNANELLAAERKAKDSRKGMWHDYDPSQEVEDSAGAAAATGDDDAAQGAVNGNAAVAQAPASKDYRDVVVTNVDDACRIRLQQISNSTTGALSRLMDTFRQFHISSGNSKAFTSAPKTGEFVAARFSEDGEWYRARVRRNDREGKTSEVVYIDYGNSETRPWSELRPLGKSEFETSALKAQAQEASLSFLQFPSGSQEYMREAQEWLTQRLSSLSSLVARVDFTDPRDGLLWVTLFDPAASQGGKSVETSSINAEVVEEGLGMVGRKLSRWERAQASAIDGLRKKEGEAKEERRGMWEYGDLTED